MKTKLYKGFLLVLCVTMFLVSQSCSGGGGGGGGNSNNEVVENEVGTGTNGIEVGTTDSVYVDINGRSSGSGTKDDPVNDVNIGIDIADEYNAQNVYVARGTYSSENGVTMVEGISLFGGYANTNGTWTIDRAVNITTINNVICSSDITENTTIDGFRIVAAIAKSMSAVVCDGGSPIISNNDINVCPTLAPNSVVKLTNGIWVKDGNPIMVNNTINGGISDSESNGIFLYNSNAKIKGNTINGGDSEDSYAIKCYGKSNPVIDENTIDANGKLINIGIAEIKSLANPVSVNNNVFSSNLNGGYYLDSTQDESGVIITSINDLPNATGNTIQY